MCGPRAAPTKQIRKAFITIPTITIRKDDFDALASIKYIVFDATLGDNHEAVTLSTDAAIRFQLGITADMDAIIDLEEIF